MTQLDPTLGTDTIANLKGLTQLSATVAVTFMICVLIAKFLIPFAERSIDKILKTHADSLSAVITSYDKVISKISENLEKTLTSLSNDIRELREELHDDLRNRLKGEPK